MIKIPAVDMRGNPDYLARFLMEEWVARRITNAHVLKPSLQTRRRNYLYIVTEFIKGKTLKQWMIDHPEPGLEDVRNIIEQVAKGLRAFHRQEVFHQDLCPDNIMIDETGSVKIIDFGSVRVAGLSEITSPMTQQNILGTAQYGAPEYFLGEVGSKHADMFSLGIICYQMLSDAIRCFQGGCHMEQKWRSLTPRRHNEGLATRVCLMTNVPYRAGLMRRLKRQCTLIRTGDMM